MDALLLQPACATFLPRDVASQLLTGVTAASMSPKVVGVDIRGRGIVVSSWGGVSLVLRG